MANEVDDIVQNVVLTGNDEVAEAFNKIQEAGVKAFEKISDAIEKNIFSFTGLATAVAGIGAAVAIAGVGMFEFVKHTEESVSSLEDLAHQTGLTTEEMSGLTAAFASNGVGSETLASAFKRLAVSIQLSFSEISKASRESADNLKGDALAVSNAQIGVATTQKALADFSKNQAIQEKQNTDTVAGARLRLRQLNGEDISDEQQALSIRQARLALTQALKKQEDDRANAANEQLKASNAAEQAVLSLNSARRKEQEDQRNDINNVTDAVKKTATGDKTALDSINASAENVFKGILKAASDGGVSLKGLGSNLKDLGGGAPQFKAAFDTIGNVLKNIEDPLLRDAVAVRAFGRSVSQEFIAVVSDPSKIDAFIKRVVDLGLAVNHADTEVSGNFRAALFTLQNDIQLVADKLATAFGPGFTTILKAIDDALIRNKQNLIDFAETIASKAVPFVESLIRILTGNPQQGDEWLKGYVDSIGTFVSTLGSAAAAVTKFVLFVSDSFSGVAKDINNALGTSIDGFTLFATAVVASSGIVQGALKAIAGAIIAAAEVTGTTLAAAFGVSITLAVSGIYAAVKAWQAYKDIVGDVGKTSHADEIFAGLQERLTAIANLIIGIGTSLAELATLHFVDAFKDATAAISNFYDAWKAANDKQAAGEKAKDDADKAAADNKKKLLQDGLTTESNVHQSAVDSHKNAEDKKVSDTKESVDKQLSEIKRLSDGQTDASNKAADAAKSALPTTATGTAAAAAAAIPKPDSSLVTDSAGTRIFGSPSTPGATDVPESLFAAKFKQIEAMLLKTEEAWQAHLDTVAIMGGDLGRAVTQPNPFTSSVSVLHPAFTEPLTNPPLPTADPRKQQVDVLAEGVKTGLDQFNVENTTAPKVPGTIPEPPAQVPLSPDLQSSSIFQSLTETLTNLLQPLHDAITPKDQTAPQPGTGSTEGGLPTVQDFSSNLDSASSSASSASAAIDSLATAAQNAATALSNVNSTNTTPGSAGNVAPLAPVGAASGGYIRGPGGPTGDRIPAMLSDEEFVHQAAATRFYGLDFMNAINNLRVPRFNMGGLVGLFSPQMPRFAGGGMVSAGGGSMSHLGTVDLTTDHGSFRVLIDRGSISDLRRAAVRKNVGANPKPSWVK